jgi:hypothetical protein
VYNINKKNQYFLERTKPYPLPIKAYENVSDLVEVIEVDVKQFKNAAKSKNIDKFVDVNVELIQTIKAFEDLFLYYNVPADKLNEVQSRIKELHKDIVEIKETAQRVFFDKEPDNLK